MTTRSRDSHTATIHEVAAQAGVSIKTVSRVLNHEPRVTPETRARVQAAVAALRYTPNPAARNLSSAVSATLGLAFPARGLSTMASGRAYTLGIQAGALAACQRLDFGLLLLPTDWTAPGAAEATVRRAQARRISGVVVASPVDLAPGLIEALDRAGLAVSILNANDLGGAHPAVAVDDRDAVHHLAQLLIERGHRRIAFVSGLRDTRTARDREAGFRAALAEAGIALPEAWVREGRFEFEGGLEAGAALLEAPGERPTAVIAANDDMALGVMHAALARGLRVPQDLSVAGFDDTEGSRFMWPPLTTVRQPLAAMAQAAIDQLAARLYPSRLDIVPQPTVRHFTSEIVLRASVGPAP